MAKEHGQAKSPLRRAVTAVGRLLGRGRHASSEVTSSSGMDVETPVARVHETGSQEARSQRAARAPRREGDIGMDRLAQSYTPTQTSMKTSFRTDGADRQRDQEFSGGFSDDRWNDEDRLTNKSGDPRIGTHGRAYEPGERTGSRDNE